MAKKRRTKNRKKRQRQVRTEASAAGSRAGRPPVRFAMMAKPIGPACNLRCEYCFYLEKHALFPGTESFRMSDEVLEAYVRKYIASQPSSGPVEFSWQGGEPMLMGVDFYRRATELQTQNAKGKAIRNTLQTNGTLLDDEWGHFLAEGGWLVGLSLDGPRDINDEYRLDVAGQSSFDAVMRGLEVLKKHKVEFNVLASVTPANASRPLEVYEFLKESGVTFIQFMPIVERLPDEVARGLGLQLPMGVRAGERLRAAKMTPWSVEPEAYGDFLIAIFDEWVRNDVGTMAVMNFEWALSPWVRRPSGVCQWMPRCGRSPVIEHNGDVYACDHYVYPEYRLGNVLTDDLQEMVQSTQQEEFGAAKQTGLPGRCRQCPVLGVCWGECPKRRFLATRSGESSLNYLCAGYRKFFAHAAPYFQAIGQLLHRGEPAARIMEYAAGGQGGKRRQGSRTLETQSEEPER